MSTFLQLCKDTARECRLSTGDTKPTAVTSQVGALQRIVKWVENSWTEIQNRPVNWRWMRHGFTVDTAADDDTYAYGDVTDTTTSSVITRHSSWRVNDPLDPPKIYLTSAGVGTQTYLIYLPWEAFKARYRIGTQNTGFPGYISVDPQNNLVLGPEPNAIYTVTGDYQRSAQILAADADIPELPTQFHQLIVYKAMEKYGFAELAPEVMERGRKDAKTLMQQLEVNQMEIPREGGPLA